MAHGYLGDGYGKNGNRDPDGEQENEHRSEWRERDRYDRQRGDRGGDRFMFEGSGRRRDQSQHGDSDRGFFSRTADEARDWFREDEHDYRPGSRERGGGSRFGGDRHAGGQPSREGSAFSSHQDDHYLSWRQQQMDALDRDYQDYCRERQQQFHSDFDTWRRNRQSGQQSSGQQMSGKQAEELEMEERDELAGTTAPHNEPQATVSPEGNATLGTNNPSNTMPGRR